MLAASVTQEAAKWLTIVGFPATILGVIFAWGQARAAKQKSEEAVTAANAAKAAAEAAERRIGDNQLLLMIPQMTTFRRELDWAVDRNERHETLRLLGDWPTLAAELQGVLRQLDADTHTKLILDLEKSTKLTGDAKDAIIGQRVEIAVATARARSSIHRTSTAASTIIGAMKMGASTHD